MPLSKEDQIKEAKSRAEGGVVPGENAQALDVVDDSARGGDQLDTRTQPGAEPAERVTSPTRGAFEDKRAAIINRFRTTRTEEVAEQAEEISEFARSGMPPEFQEPEAVIEETAGEQPGDVVVEDEAAPVAAAAPPKTVRVKVNGVESDVPYETIIAKAQMALASEDILGEAKALLADAKNTVRRSDQPGHHAGEQPGHHANAGAQPDATTAATELPNQEDQIDKLIDTLQFGDPTEAKDRFKTVMSEEVRAQVTTALQTDRLKDEGARTVKVIKDFASQNPEIANDPLARRVIDSLTTEIQAEDIRALGIDPAQLQMPIADAHQYYRANGYKVSTPADMLTKAVDQYKTWKGGTPTPQAPPKPGAPRIEVNVDRTVRRQAIPQQPSRTVTPKPNNQGNAAQPRDRSSIVEQMRQKRAMPKNGVVVS